MIRLEISWDVTPETFASVRRTDGRDQVGFVMLSLQSRPVLFPPHIVLPRQRKSILNRVIEMEEET